jgi:predicted  nucleic acid-binding Zn-ribbon protein
MVREQLRKLSRLQSFDNRMATLYRNGLPRDASGRRIGPKQKAFIRERESMACRLNGDLLRHYERLRESRVGANAVVPVVNGVCRGCFMAVTKSLIVELLQGAEFITCEHCGRILYLE